VISNWSSDLAYGCHHQVYFQSIPVNIIFDHLPLGFHQSRKQPALKYSRK
jgi:hypothetical protein